MGTRHLTIVHKDGKYPIAQYGQWDGYPSGQGRTILDFLKEKKNVENLRKNLDKVHEGTKEELDTAYRSVGIKDEWMNKEQKEKFKEKYPQLSRDTGAKILELVANLKKKQLLVSTELDFAKDSLFCEWAYVIDFDTKVFEVYRGFNQEPLAESERFAFFNKDTIEEKYHPIRLIASYPLDDLPDSPVFLELLSGFETA